MTVGIFGGVILVMVAGSVTALIWAMIKVAIDNLKKKKKK